MAYICIKNHPSDGVSNLLDTVGPMRDLVACPLTPIEEARGRAGPTDGDDYPAKKISPLPAGICGQGERRKKHVAKLR